MHLRGNADTKYKIEVMRLLEETYNKECASNFYVKEHAKRNGKFMVVYNSDFPDLVETAV